MRSNQILEDAFGRIVEVANAAVDGLDTDALTWQPDPGANTIAWLVWHLTRVQDDHVTDLSGEPQEWTTGAWASHFGLAPDSTETGYGHDIDQVLAVRPSGPEPLTGYLAAVTERTRAFLAGVEDDDLDRVIDSSWDPPVTMGVRLVSVVDDGIQHAGQAAYVRGLYDRAVG